jgi:hypothetical protein
LTFLVFKSLVTAFAYLDTVPVMYKYFLSVHLHF